MDKNTVIAITLSLLVLIGSQYYYSKTAPKRQPPAKQAKQEAPAEARQPIPEQPIPAVKPLPPTPATGKERLITVETELYSATISSIGGTVRDWKLKKHLNREGGNVSLLLKEGPYRVLGIGWKGDFSASNENYNVRGGDLRLEGPDETGTLTFEYSDGQYSITRTYTFYSDSYHFDLVDKVSGAPGYQITLGGDFGIHLEESDRLSHMGPVLLEDMDRVEIKPGKIDETRVYTGDVKWIAIEDKYFFSSIIPETKMEDAMAWKSGESAVIAFNGTAGENRFMVYAGPKEIDRLKKLGVGIESIVDFGFFSIIARPIFWLLIKLYGFVGNYGWAIIILTIIIRIPFIPIVHKGQKSMKRLQEVQPLMQQIKEQYKKDTEKMNKEMMELYKRHKVNPMGGCLPMLLQIPVFFALYKVLLVAIELRGAPFMFWLTDLSQKDPYYILPIVMGATMFLQQKMTPTGGDPKQQKIMMFMPIIFTFLFLGFASGLVLYWLVNNLLSIAQQVFINRSKS
jgi:YidC/Oxa1 family membrane protein insertase